MLNRPVGARVADAMGLVDDADARALMALQSARVRPYAGRMRVMAGLMSLPLDQALTASELHRELICSGQSVALSSVYAGLKVLAEHGLVQECTARPGAYRLSPALCAPPPQAA